LQDYFISSIAGLLSASGVYPLGGFGMLSVILGAIGLKKINKNPDKYKGRGFAIAGIIIGSLEIVGLLIMVVSFAISL
jgi:hypothetical protein